MSLPRLPVALSLAAVMALPTAVQAAGPHTYSGTEAKALKCAAYYSYSAEIMARNGMIKASTKANADQLAAYILTNHVSGSERQKMQAYSAVLKRMPRSGDGMMDEADRHLDWCARTFLR